MNTDRVKKASKSFIWMTITFIVETTTPFIIRTIMISYLGNEYVGLNSFFLSILQVFSVSELGISDALVYFLYKPMAECDKERVNQILYLYRTAYRIIGFIVLVIAVLFIPFLPYLINADVPVDINIYILYVLYILDLMISYFYKNYCLSIFQTNQSLYYRYKMETFVMIFVYGIQMFLIIRFRNYYGYVIMIPMATILMNTVTWVLSRKYYQQYYPEGKLEKSFFLDFWKKVSSMALMKLRDVFRFSLDSIVISAFSGLALLAKYNNYYMLFSVGIMFMNLFSKSMLQSLGNSVASESVESNRGVIKMYSFLLQLVILVLSSGFMCLCNIFITIWIGEEYIFPLRTVILFVITFYLLQLASVSSLIRNSTGIWSVGKGIPVAETVANLVFDIVLVRYFAQDGVLIGTIVSLALINIPFETTVVFREYFKEKPFKVLGDYLLNGVVAVGIIYVCYYVTGLFMPESGIIAFVVKGVVCVGLSVVLFVLVHIRDSRLKDLVGIFRRVLKNNKGLFL